MTSSTHDGSDTELVSALKAGRPDAFASLYKQYAPVLLGVIRKIVRDEDQAESVLIGTFATVRATIADYRPGQPLFLWLFNIARRTATAALGSAKPASAPVVQLTPAGLITTPKAIAPLFAANDETSNYQHCLNAVLFDRCTPEEASQLVGLPVAEARQHLRQAFLQLRTTMTSD